MAAEIVLYFDPMSRGRIVHWMLEEVGVPYRIELVSLQRGEQKKPAFLAINPMGKVPAIVHGKTVVTETGAICAYLADAFPAAGLAPDVRTSERGTYLRWLFFGAGCVEPAIIDKVLERPVPERTAAVGYGTYADTANTLEKAITPGPYILGQRFSAADVYVGSEIGFGMMTKALDARPAFTTYHARLTERPAYKRSTEQGEKLMAQMKASS
jgi:glutathione S-transferase